MSKIKTTSKVSLKLPSWLNLGRRGACTELLTPDTGHESPPTPLKGLRQTWSTRKYGPALPQAQYTQCTTQPPPLGTPQQMIDAKKHSAQKSWKSRAFPSFSLSSPHVICLLINENIAKNNWFQKFKNFSQKVLWWSFYSAQTATLL